MSNIHLLKRLNTELKAKQKIENEKSEKYNRIQSFMSAGIILGFVYIMLAPAFSILPLGLLFVVAWLVLILLYIINTILGNPSQDPKLLKEIENHKLKISKIKSEIISEKAENERIMKGKTQAKIREMARDYDSAIKIWEELGEISEAARVRKLKAEQGAVKITQKVVHGDEVTKTKIKDSVVSKSNIGSGGDDKFTKLKELKEMLAEGLIDDDEFKQMKKEILGK